MDFIFRLIAFICEILSIAIFLRVIVSWIAPRSTNILVVTLYRITEPTLAPLRRLIPRMGTLDFSPLVAIIFLQLIISLLR